MGNKRKIIGDIIDLGIMPDHPAALAGRVLIYTLADKLYQRFPDGAIKAVGSGDGTGGTGWASTTKLDDFDASASTAGLVPTGDDSKIILTATEAGQEFVFNAVDIPLALEQNYFCAIALAAANFTIKVQGFNSAFKDAGAIVGELKLNEVGSIIVPFQKKDYTKVRLVIISQGAGTITLSRGEWTDSYWKEVQITSDPVIVERSGNAGEAITASDNIPFGIGAEKITSFTMPFDGQLEISASVYTSASNTATALVYKGGVLYKNLVAYSDVSSRVKTGYLTIAAKKDDVYSLRLDTSVTLSTNGVYHWATFTATPIGTSKGIVAAAEVDLSQYQGDFYDLKALGVINGFVNVTFAYAQVFTDASGRVWLKNLQMGGTLAAATRTKFESTITGVSSPLNQSQSLDGYTSVSTTATRTYFNNTTGAITWDHASASTNYYYASASALLISAKPSWATQPTIKPATIIAPVAVVDLTSCVLGYKAGMTIATGSTDTKILRVLGYDILNRAVLSKYFDILDSAANGTRLIAKKDFRLTASISGDITGGDSALGLSKNASSLTARYTHLPQSERVTAAMGYTNVSGGSGTSTIKAGDILRIQIDALPIDSSPYFSLSLQIDSIETGHIASSKEEIHKNATYLSSNETEAGYCEFTGKTIYKRTIYFPTTVSASTASYLNIGTGITPVNSINYSGSLWLLQSNAASGTSTTITAVYFDKSSGYVGVSVSSYVVGAGTRIVFEYTKD